MPGTRPGRGAATGRSELPNAILFFGSRAVNGALILAQVALIARLYPAAEAARFFVFWTIVWCGSVWLRFGVDQLLPKFAALALRNQDLAHLGGFGRIIRRTLPSLALFAPVLLALLVPGISGVDVLVVLPALVLAAVGSAIVYVLAALI